MQIQFTDEELEIQKTVKKFVKKDILPISRDLNSKGELPEDMRERFLSMGLLKSAFPEEYGGVDGTFTGLVLAMKELSYGSLVPAWMLFENFMLAYPLLHYGSDSLKSRYLRPLISMETIGALAFTESETGSDPTQLKTIARKTDGGWVINGSKRFITNSAICDGMILFAKSGDSVTAFLVEPKKNGYKAGKREAFMQGYSFDNGDLYLEDYFAPDTNIIGEEGQGFEILLKTESFGKIAFCSLFAGLAERAVDLAVHYANTRSHRGKAIGHRFQMTQIKLAGLMAKTDALNSYLYHICAKADRGEDIFMDAAALKLFVAQEIKQITSDAMEIHGAYGLSEEYEIGSLYRTAVSAQVVMGSLDIQRVIVAKSMLARGTIYG